MACIMWFIRSHITQRLKTAFLYLWLEWNNKPQVTQPLPLPFIRKNKSVLIFLKEPLVEAFFCMRKQILSALETINKLI